jgi:hypothetical protein
MTLNRSYTAELELLITDTLLPIFDKYYRDRGELPKYTGINPSLLKQIKKRKVVPALFLPKEKLGLQLAA